MKTQSIEDPEYEIIANTIRQSDKPMSYWEAMLPLSEISFKHKERLIDEIIHPTPRVTVEVHNIPNLWCNLN